MRDGRLFSISFFLSFLCSVRWPLPQACCHLADGNLPPIQAAKTTHQMESLGLDRSSWTVEGAEGVLERIFGLLDSYKCISVSTTRTFFGLLKSLKSVSVCFFLMFLFAFSWCHPNWNGIPVEGSHIRLWSLRTHCIHWISSFFHWLPVFFVVYCIFFVWGECPSEDDLSIHGISLKNSSAEKD